MSTAAEPATAIRAVTDEERYLFDLEGYLVVPDALDRDQLAAINAAFDDRVAQADPANLEPYFPGSCEGKSLLHWGQTFRDLIDSPRIMPYLREFIADDPRLDHDYAAVIRAGARTWGGGLHGGNVPFDECFLYAHRDGRIRGGLTVVAYNLRDVNPGDGGFACIAGSHKANYPLPKGWGVLADGQRAACVRQIAAPAGSAVIFTEALTHGTLPWKGAGERRTLFYKYSPRSISWSARYYDARDFVGLSEAQRGMLEAPNARYGHRFKDA
jgi:ectoine hydroxylase-related dioxygenase (phytanoyl-CoA dioxygenase family)